MKCDFANRPSYIYCTVRYMMSLYLPLMNLCLEDLHQNFDKLEYEEYERCVGGKVSFYPRFRFRQGNLTIASAEQKT